LARVLSLIGKTSVDAYRKLFAEPLLRTIRLLLTTLAKFDPCHQKADPCQPQTDGEGFWCPPGSENDSYRLFFTFRMPSSSYPEVVVSTRLSVVCVNKT
jgi:hypothetical protein